MYLKGSNGEVRIGQVRTGQVRVGQVRAGQVRAGQVRTGQVRTGQVKSGLVKFCQDRSSKFESNIKSYFFLEQNVLGNGV